VPSSTTHSTSVSALSLGSPAQAAVLASATGFGPEYLMVPEDLGTPMPNSDGPNRVEQRGDLAVGGWEPQPAASVFLPNIARLSSAAAHYESDRTNRNVRFAARHGRFRPQAVQEPETAAGGEILRRQTECRQTGPPPFLPGPITESDDGDVIGNIDFQGHEFFRDTQRGHDRRQHDGGWGWAFCKQAR
jgi:hypothetical protein